MPPRKRPLELIVRTVPTDYVSPFIPWKRKELFRLQQLESIPQPTSREKERMAKLRERIYGNLHWFRKVRQIRGQK